MSWIRAKCIRFRLNGLREITKKVIRMFLYLLLKDKDNNITNQSNRIIIVNISKTIMINLLKIILETIFSNITNQTHQIYLINQEKALIVSKDQNS
jgi:hypothetical protein